MLIIYKRDCASVSDGTNFSNSFAKINLIFLESLFFFTNIFFLATGWINYHLAVLIILYSELSCQENGYFNDIPTTLHRSKADCPVPEVVPLLSY